MLRFTAEQAKQIFRLTDALEELEYGIHYTPDDYGDYTREELEKEANEKFEELKTYINSI